MKYLINKKITQIPELKLRYKYHKKVPRLLLASVKDYHAFFKMVFPIDLNYKEALIALFIDAHHNSIGWTMLSIGGTHNTTFDIRVLASTAILANASSVILCHNHPSGILRPSAADIDLTKSAIGALNLFDIMIYDHLIISKDDFFSMRREGSIT